ncbi:MAG: glycosyltransferase [Candidatus Eremiobacteraeota bacterium]|nr:glycosyltransferase [Candidatus Eremiobacteraeota bacterium]MBC5823960.1 glycosyltransferase [Candidatus Eremiobacteraeota bacterium]
MLTHLSAAVALAFAARTARFDAGWFDIPLIDASPMQALPPISIIVPARNEARSIERCVRSLLAQRHVDAEIIVVDDRSEDATPQILAQLALEFPQLRVLSGESLPEGWVGKPWALHQGARYARGDWYLFTDADSRHEPAATASALSFALGAQTDALSIVTAQELGSFWERATLPFILAMILYASGTFEQINDPLQPERALANGQYILVSRAAYDGLGGHAALRGELVDDVSFARNLKADGRFRLLLGGGTRLARVRMYHSFGEIWEGFTKNLFVGARGNVPALLGAVAYMTALSAPPVLALRAALRGRSYESAEALAAAATTVVTMMHGIGVVGMPRATAFLQPLGTAILAALAVNSTLRVLSGRGVTWRGRRYSGRPSSRRTENAVPEHSVALKDMGCRSCELMTTKPDTHHGKTY